ncbi:MAG: hypothetical protein FJX76_13030 [Armatimonadetes bacterium]|nr:hypothetical protein [Armatimonadota bacterium]
MRSLVVLLIALTFAPAIAADEVVYTMPGAFSVSRPSAAWKWVTDAKDPEAVALSNSRTGIEIVFRWVANSKKMNSEDITRTLRLRMMNDLSYEGQAFSSIRPVSIGGTSGAGFKVERTTGSSVVHRTKYVVASHRTHALVIAVMGGARLSDKHQAEVDAVLKSVTFTK